MSKAIELRILNLEEEKKNKTRELESIQHSRIEAAISSGKELDRNSVREKITESLIIPSNPNESNFYIYLSREKEIESDIHLIDDLIGKLTDKLTEIQTQDRDKLRDFEIQKALIERDTAIAQAETAKSAMEAVAESQKEHAKSLDKLIDGIKTDGQNED